jgi:phenylacetyl-CoA:acceptor oxidoreductase 27-kDa subunit
MKWGMVIDLTKCMRCHACVAACRVEHFLPLRITWVKLIAYETDDGGVLDVSTYPVRCNQCKEAPCVDVCPTGATKQRADGIVHIDADKCIGCRYCVIACPYQNRTFLSKDKDPGYFPGYPQTRFEIKGKTLYPHQKGTTMKCNFCMEKIDYGLAHNLKPGIDRDATPACVNTCQARALTFGDLDDPDSPISRLIVERKALQLQRELGTDPSVYYVDGKIGGKDNKAPEHARTGYHIQHLSSVEARAKEVFAWLKSKN